MNAPRQRDAVSLGAMLALLLGLQATAQHAYGVLAPHIRDDLQAGADEMGLIASALYLGTMLAAFGLGGWVDRRPPRLVVMICAIGIASSLLVIAGARTLGLISLGYLLVGLARGAIPPLTDRVGYELASPSRRGLVFGVKQTGTPFGAVLAAILLAPIASGDFGWRGAMIILAVLMLAGYAVGARMLPPSPVGAASTDRDQTLWATLTTLVRRLTVPMTLSFGLGIHQATVVTFLTLYLVDTAGLSAGRAASWFAVLSVGGAVGRVAWGSMSDHLFRGHRTPALASSAFLAGSMALLVGTRPTILGGTSGVILVAAYGFVSQGWVGISRAWGAELAGPGLSGRAGGIMLGSMMFGGLIGPLSFGIIVESSGYRNAWIILGSSTLFVGALALREALRETYRRGGRTRRMPELQRDRGT